MIEEAYDLNCPLEGTWVKAKEKKTDSFLQVLEPNIMVDTIKQGEEKDGIILRLFEAYGRRTKVHMSLPWAQGKRAVDCGCMENELAEMGVCQGELEFEMRPYEIKTIKVRE